MGLAFAGFAQAAIVASVDLLAMLSRTSAFDQEMCSRLYSVARSNRHTLGKGCQVRGTGLSNDS